MSLQPAGAMTVLPLSKDTVLKHVRNEDQLSYSKPDSRCCSQLPFNSSHTPKVCECKSWSGPKPSWLSWDRLQPPWQPHTEKPGRAVGATSPGWKVFHTEIRQSRLAMSREEIPPWAEAERHTEATAGGQCSQLCISLFTFLKVTPQTHTERSEGMSEKIY